MRALAGVARGLKLGDYVRLGRGEEGTGGRDKSSILADTLEAVIGAVYFELGLGQADALVHRLFDPVISRSAGLGAGLDWKTSLQELTAQGFLGVPEYHVEESGPDHQKFFRATVRVGGRSYGTGDRPVQEGSRAAGGRGRLEGDQQRARPAVGRRGRSNGGAQAAGRGPASGAGGRSGPPAAASTGRAPGTRADAAGS